MANWLDIVRTLMPPITLIVARRIYRPSATVKAPESTDDFPLTSEEIKQFVSRIDAGDFDFDEITKEKNDRGMEDQQFRSAISLYVY